MAKKKKSKQTQEGFSYSVEFIGLILILIGICGLACFGPVGLFIEEFAMFLAGEYWFIVLIALVYLGGYSLFKRKEFPKEDGKSGFSLSEINDKKYEITLTDLDIISYPLTLQPNA